MNKARILQQLDQIKNIVSQGNFATAVEDLLQLCKIETLPSHYDEVVALSSRYEAAIKEKHSGGIDYKEFGQQYSNLLGAVLYQIDEIKKDINTSKQASTPAFPADLTPGYPQFVPVEIVALDQTLAALAQQLQQSKQALAILGVGGLGKTTLAQKYYSTHKHSYTHHAWVDIQGKDLMTAFAFNETLLASLGIAAFAQGDKPEDKFKEVLKALSSLPGEKLLVLDAVDKELTREEYQLLKSLPKDAAYKILLTTRYNHKAFNTYQLPAPGREQAKEIYSLYRGEDSEEKGVDELLQFIGCHPLLIELIAKTLKESFHLSPEKVLERFRKNELQSIKALILPERDYQETTIQNFLKVVFDMTDMSADEQLFLMQLCVLLTLQAAPFKDLCFAFQLDEDALEEKLARLEKRGWISRVVENEEVKIAVHQAVGVAVKDRIKPDDKNCELLIDSFSDKLNAFINENPALKFSCTRYAPLLASLLTYLSTECTDKVANVFHHLASFYKALGRLEEALEVQMKSLEISERVLGISHPDLAVFYNNLSIIYKDLSRLEEALEVQIKSLEIWERVLDSSHPALATSYNNLSVIYQSLGRLEEALEAQIKAVEIRERVLGSSHPDLSVSYNNLSTIYYTLGRLEEALEAQMKSLEICERVLGSSHPNFSVSYNNLSLIYEALGRLEEALEAQIKAVEILKQVLGSSHSDLALSYYNLAFIYLAQENTKDFIIYLLKSIEIWQVCYPNGHPHLTIALETLEQMKRLEETNK